MRFVVPCPVGRREKKKEKEREELWKKLEDLELKRGLRSDGIIPT